ncbi:MAG: hypothetical protein ACE5HB_00760, partial [Terriglobia bacterium]
MQLKRIQVNAATLGGIAKLLRVHFAVEEEIEGVYRIIGGGTNDENHRVVETISGRRYGIKTKARGGGQEGEKREAAFSRACEGIAVKEACRAVCVNGIVGLQGFDKSTSVVT